MQNDPTIGFSFILQLTGVHGSQQFDKLTKTKTVESLLTTMDSSGIKAYIDHLFSQVAEKAGDEQYVSVFPLSIAAFVLISSTQGRHSGG